MQKKKKSSADGNDVCEKRSAGEGKNRYAQDSSSVKGVLAVPKEGRTQKTNRHGIAGKGMTQKMRLALKMADPEKAECQENNRKKVHNVLAQKKRKKKIDSALQDGRIHPYAIPIAQLGEEVMVKHAFPKPPEKK